VQQEGYAVRQACELLDLSPSSYYYHSNGQAMDQVEMALIVEAGNHPTYGTRRLTHQLRRPPYEFPVNRKRIQRLARQHGLLRPQKARKTRTTNSQHPYPRYENLVKDLEITYPDQVWVSDITYIRLKQDFVYLAIIMDVYTRAIRGWSLSYALDQNLSLDALNMALASHSPEIHHSDQGVQYACSAYIDLLKKHNIHISMAAVGKVE
jgi:transposase InsO family protein